MSKPRANQPAVTTGGYVTSWKRCLLAAVLVIIGIAWIVVYINFAKDAALWNSDFGGKKPHDPTGFMAGLGRWNFLIGFSLAILGLWVAAHPTTPLGRGRGVLIMMLGSFLLGLVYIVTFYFLGSGIADVPLMKDLDQYNLLVGMALLAVGFVYATRWE